MKEYIGSQQHFEDEVNAHYDKMEREKIVNDSRVKEEPMFPDTKKWTDKDLCEFAEWCSARQWFITQDGLWYKLTGHISKYGDNYEKKTTSQLLEVWEVETGRRKA